MRAKALTAALIAATAFTATIASADPIRGVPTYEQLGPIEYIQGHLNGSVTFSTGPVYSQPAPIYRQAAPVYQQPAPVYRQQAPIYRQPAPVAAQHNYGYKPVRPGRQIRERLRNQQDRISRAEARGAITQRESNRLQRRAAQIRDTFRAARQDGRGIGPREQAFLNAQLDEQSQRIRRMARNDRRVDVYGPRYNQGYGQPVRGYRP